MNKTVMRKVLRVDRSPMNEQRWLMTLECGHEVWVTRQRGFNRNGASYKAPKGKYYCPACTSGTPTDTLASDTKETTTNRLESGV